MFGFRLTRSTFFAAALLAVTPTFAQMKVAVLDTQKALTDTAEIKKVQADMDAKFKPRQEKLGLLQREIETLNNQLTTMAGKLTPQAQAEMDGSLKKKQKDYQRLGEDLQADVEAAQGDILAKASTQMKAVIQAYATANGYDLVLDINNAFYFKPTMDVTKDITAAYDKANPAK